jgi:hypothetical protein
MSLGTRYANGFWINPVGTPESLGILDFGLNEIVMHFCL